MLNSEIEFTKKIVHRTRALQNKYFFTESRKKTFGECSTALNRST